mgnify:CR=1 FL=1
MAINREETTEQLDTDSLCTVAKEIVKTASEDLTRWHPQGTSESARKELIVGALDEIVLALGERWRESVDVTLALETVWAKLDDLNAIN